MFCVYMHICPNNKRYIGITMKKPEYRWGKNGSRYREHNVHFWNAIQKYGWHNIEHIIVAKDLTKEEACDMEIELIRKYNTTDRKFGYNKSTGGECSSCGVHRVLSNETRRKISEAQMGKKLPREVVEKIIESRSGYRHSDETKSKISKAHNIPIEQLSADGVIIAEYGSILEASIKTGVQKQNICKCCRGERKTAGGFIWKYRG